MLTQESSEPGLTPELWLEEHGDVLFRFALARVRDRHVAEDLVQETFVGALRARGSYGGRASERTWLVAILRHKIVDHLRKQGRDQPLAVEDGDLGDAVVDRMFDSYGHWRQGPKAWLDPGQALEATEFWEVYDQCLKALPARHGAVYALHATEEHSTDEVCKVFDITPSNLWVILHRARLRLRNCLEINWFGDDQGRRGRC
jgi:RNA polymerase sigma-70 factor (ECF subfamily)